MWPWLIKKKRPATRRQQKKPIVLCMVLQITSKVQAGKFRTLNMNTPDGGHCHIWLVANLPDSSDGVLSRPPTAVGSVILISQLSFTESRLDLNPSPPAVLPRR